MAHLKPTFCEVNVWGRGNLQEIELTFQGFDADIWTKHSGYWNFFEFEVASLNYSTAVWQLTVERVYSLLLRTTFLWVLYYGTPV